MAEKLYSYADKQVMDEVGSGGGGGGGSSTLVIHANENATLDKTWKQIHDHMSGGGMAVIVMADDPVYGAYDQVASVANVGLNVSDSEIYYSVETGLTSYSTNNENGYPSIE